jgi:hypothetical protein
MKQVDPVRWHEFCTVHKFCSQGFDKYFDMTHCVTNILFNRPLMSLIEKDPGMSILDISAGFCAFGLVCRALGHKVTITECSIPICNAAQDLLGFKDRYLLDYRPGREWCFVPIPAQIGKFDVITAIACGPHSVWNLSDWEKFFCDAFTHLKKDGQIYLWPKHSPGCSLMFEYLCDSKYKLAYEKTKKKGVVVWK